MTIRAQRTQKASFRNNIEVTKARKRKLSGFWVTQNGLTMSMSIRRKRRRGYAETGHFHSIHTPTGRVWNEKGLSHGLKTVHRTVFTAAPLSSPAFSFGSGGTPEGTRYIKVLPPSSRRQATVHRTVAFKFSSPFYWEYKNGVSQMGYTRNRTFPFHPHPYGARLE